MATLLTYLCMKNNKQSLIPMAIPLGFAFDFVAVMLLLGK